MRLDPSTPVLVGVGQVTNRPGTEGEGPLTDRPEPVDLMVDAVRAAMEDCDGVRPGAAARSGRILAERVDSLRVVSTLSWEYPDPGLLVAEALAIDPRERRVTTTGGNSPQALVNATAAAIGRGELDVAIIVGADCGYTQAAVRRHPDRPVLPWTVQAADVVPAEPFGLDRWGTTDAEEARGLDAPIHVYPLFEHALRAETGRTVDEQREHIGSLWSGLSHVAASNPAAWLARQYGPDELITASDTNRLVTPPYTKLLCANMQVDQGAALILTSVGAAEAAGVPRDRWVFPLAGADANDHWFLSHRADFISSPAIRMNGRAALGLIGVSIEEVAHLDLYSCFPSAVEIAAKELQLSTAESRPLTTTGGLTFAGGPGNNYSTHAIAALAQTLREDPGALGLITGVGFYLSKHSLGLYGTDPGPVRGGGPETADLPEGTDVSDAGGFYLADPQRAVFALPQCAPDADAEGEVVVETYSVWCDRTGVPERAVVACRTPEDRRAWANVTDPDHLAMLVTEEGCGRLGTLRADGEVDLA